MMYFFKRLYRGMRYSKKYGSHPGWPFLWLMLFMCPFAASGRPDQPFWVGLAIGVGVWSITILPMFLVGCWGRGD